MIKRRLEKLERATPDHYQWCLGDAGLRTDGRFIPCPYLHTLNVENPPTPYRYLLEVMLSTHGLKIGVTKQTLEAFTKELAYPHESKAAYLEKLAVFLEQQRDDC